MENPQLIEAFSQKTHGFTQLRLIYWRVKLLKHIATYVVFLQMMGLPQVKFALVWVPPE